MKRLLGSFAICTFFLACNPGPTFHVNSPDEATFFHDPASAPIVAVGRILSNEKAGKVRQWHPKEDSISTYQVQLFRVTAEIENILRGGPLPNKAEIYYFAFVGNVGGPPGLGMAGGSGTWHIGDRGLFFLREESKKLRTECDLSARCVPPVLSGSHPNLKVDPKQPLAYSIVDLLLTRGIDCHDQQMIEAVSNYAPSLFSQSYAIRKLRQIAKEEVPSVRAAACKRLTVWEHTSCTE
jgi:hypothetical protein